MNGEERSDNQPDKKTDWYWQKKQYRLNRREWNIVYPINAFLLIFAALTAAAVLLQSVYTKRALDETRRDFRSAERPHISLGRKDGVVAEFTAPNDKTGPQPVGLKIYLQNGGQSPALSINVGLIAPPLSFLGSGPPGQPFSPTTFPFDFIKRTTTGVPDSGISIAPQSEYVKIIPQQFSQEQWERARKGEIAPLLTGILDYCDEFGNYTCRQFTLFWQGPPEDTFIEISEISCVSLYSYPPHNPSEGTYLLPCEQPDEREAREKQEHRNQVEGMDKANAATSTPSATATP